MIKDDVQELVEQRRVAVEKVEFEKEVKDVLGVMWYSEKPQVLADVEKAFIEGAESMTYSNAINLGGTPRKEYKAHDPKKEAYWWEYKSHLSKHIKASVVLKDGIEKTWPTLKDAEELSQKYTILIVFYDTTSSIAVGY